MRQPPKDEAPVAIGAASGNFAPSSTTSSSPRRMKRTSTANWPSMRGVESVTDCPGVSIATKRTGVSVPNVATKR